MSNDIAPPSSGGSLLEGLLDRISELMGDAVSMSAFRYAAFEEGRRIGQGYRADDTGQMLARLDAVLGQSSELREDKGNALRLRVTGSRMLQSGRPVVQGIALGVLEGALLASRGSRFTGSVEDQEEDACDVLLRRQEGGA